MSFEDMNNIVKSLEKLTPEQLAAIENGQAVPVKAPSGPSRHYQKNLLKNARKSTLEVPTNYVEDIFQARNNKYTGAEYIPHKWKLGKDVNEPGFASGMDDLSRVILDAKSDVKFNKRLTTELGAQYWVAQKNKNLPANKQWKCIVTDLNEDGVPEIVICDANGDVRYVNGLHLSKSKTLLYAAHQNYIDTEVGKPWEIASKRRRGQIGPNDMALKKWIYDQTSVDPSNPYGPLLVKDDLAKTGYKSRAPNTCNLFMKYVTKPQYDVAMANFESALSNDPLRLKVLKSAGSIIKINALLYTKHISGPAYNELKARNFSDKDMKKKYKGTNISPFTDLCAQKINEIASDEKKGQAISFEIAQYLDDTNKAIEGNYGRKKFVAPKDWDDRRVDEESFNYNKWRHGVQTN